MQSTSEELLISIFKDIIDVISRTVGTCSKDELFLARYLAGAILSYIEENEQDLALSMQYNKWVPIDADAKEKITSKLESYINRFSKACKGESLDDTTRNKVKETIKQERVIERTLCYLYVYGIYDDNVSKYIVIKDVPEEKCEDILYSSERVYVRSRFIEIARNLYSVKQRFPDTPLFEAKPLVDRVFAYVEPRNLPLGKIHPREAFKDMESLVKELYRTYKTVKLGCEPNQQEYDVLSNVLGEFFNRIYSVWSEPFLFYEYQVRGIRKLIESMIAAIKDGRTFVNIIEAQTGAGKTEIFVLAMIILAFIRKLAWHYDPRINIESNTPAAVIIYPRQALASNQINRLLKYLHELNNIIKQFFGNDELLITLSMNYAEVRSKRDYKRLIAKYREELLARRKIERIPWRTESGVTVQVGLGYDEEKKMFYVELKYFKCPDEAYPRIMYDPQRNELITGKIYCGREEISYLRVTKDDVKQSPGDIHITLFETLRQNLWSRVHWKKLFGIPELDGTLMFVLDEIHTYTGICGARYAYVLRRVLTRIKHQVGRKHGFVIVGVSATIPNPVEFIKELFLERVDNPEEIFIRVSEQETIPMGNEYFFIVVPTLKYMVNMLSVSIQTVMTLFYNLPPLPNKNSEYSKRALVFIDNLDVVIRAKYDIRHAVRRDEVRGKCTELPYGLQDLRNPFNPCFIETVKDYSDPIAPSSLDKFDLSRIYRYNSWKDGELWWPYAIEYKMLAPRRFTRVIEYTSRRKDGGVEEGDIIITTSALEVGVDYHDVVLIYQHGIPPNISALIQRAGRAGRRIFKNPLTRTAVAVQLSPDIPLQTSYFEIFTRSKSLREALKYDKLYVATSNEYIIKQTLLETIIDYLIYKSHIYTHGIENVIKFECEIIPRKVEELLNTSEKWEFISYLTQVFPRAKRETIEKYVGDILRDIQVKCDSLRGSGAL